MRGAAFMGRTSIRGGAAAIDYALGHVAPQGPFQVQTRRVIDVWDDGTNNGWPDR